MNNKNNVSFRLLSIVLSLMLFTSILPAAAFADPASGEISGETIALENTSSVDQKALFQQYMDEALVKEKEKYYDPDEYVYSPVTSVIDDQGAAGLSQNNIIQGKETPLNSQQAQEKEKLDELIAKGDVANFSSQDMAFLEQKFKVDSASLMDFQQAVLSLENALLFAQIKQEFGLSAAEILQHHKTGIEGARLMAEMSAYRNFLHQKHIGGEIDQELKSYLLEGFPLDQIIHGYVASRTFQIPMNQLLVQEADKTNYPVNLSDISRENFRLFAMDWGVNEQALVDYAENQRLTFRQMERALNNGRILEVELRDPVQAEAIRQNAAALIAAANEEAQAKKAEEEKKQEEIMAQIIVDSTAGIGKSISFNEALAMVRERKVNLEQEAQQRQGSSMNLEQEELLPGSEALMVTAASATREEITQYISAPFTYEGQDYNQVNMNDGFLKHTEVDAVIPGRNGLDLSIGHQFLSNQAGFSRAYGMDEYSAGWQWAAVYQYQAYQVRNDGGTWIRWSSLDQPVQGPQIFQYQSDAVNYINDKIAAATPIYNYFGPGAHLYYHVWYSIYSNAEDGGMYRWTEMEDNTYFNDRYGLGQGWKFMFSSIEEYGPEQYLHLSDGTVHQIRWLAAGQSNLLDYNLRDLQLLAPVGEYHNGVEQSWFTLTYKDGKKEFFSYSGRLIGIRDRYGNTINLVHTTQNGLPKITITDTLGNITTISGVKNGNNHVMTVQMPQGAIKYYIERKISTDPTSLMLNQVEDQLGNQTVYFFASNNYITVDYYNNGESVRFRFLSPMIMQHANGYFTNFTTESVRHNVGPYGGWKTISRITRIRESTHGPLYLDTNYTYSPNNLTGYPTHRNLGNIPSNFVYYATATYVELNTGTGTFTDQRKVTSHFNRDHLMTRMEEHTGSGRLTANHAYEYNYYYKTPTKVTSKYYNDDSSGYREEITATTYDEFANLTGYWPPLAEGNTSNSEYKTTYTYDLTYSQPLTKTYKQDTATTVQERYELDGTKKNVIGQEVWVNNVRKGKTAFTYDGYGNVTSIRKYKDNFTDYLLEEYAYPNGAHLTQTKISGVQNADGSLAEGTPGFGAGIVVTKTQYNNMGWPLSKTDANNQTTGFSYNAKGDITLITNPDNTIIRLDRNYTANTLTLTDEKGTQLRYEYTSVGKEKALVDVASGTALRLKDYDHLRRLISEQTLYGKTTYIYDELSRLVSAETKDNQGVLLDKETYAYNEAYGNPALKRVQKTVHGDGDSPSIVTTEYYDKAGRMVQSGRFMGSTEWLDTYTYDYIGNRLTDRQALAADRGLAYSAKWEYDFAGRVTKQYNADGAAATSTYNALGLKASATDFAGTAITYTYDHLGRLTEEKSALEQNGSNIHYQLQRYTYDPAGNIKRKEITNNPIGSSYTWAKTEYDYDNRHRLEYVTMYDGAAIDNVTKYTYDSVGNTLTMQAGMSSKAAADGKVTTYSYDRFGNMLTLTDALNQVESYQYDLSSLMTGKTDRNGNQFAYTYDGLMRPRITTVRKGGAVAEQISYSYALTGNKKREESTTRGWLSYQYDSLGRLINAAESSGAVKQYTYDKADNRLTFLAKMNGAAVLDMAYTYDNQNRLSTVKQNGSLVGTYSYDVNGNRSALQYANGVTTQYTYNKANWLTSLSNQEGSSLLSSYAYSYFADGNQKTKTDNLNWTTSYTYDGAGRLKSESESTGLTLSYTYDRSGNRAAMTATGTESYSTSYVYDANNRLKTETRTEGGLTKTTVYGYDANGNQLSQMQEVLAPIGQEPSTVTFDPSYAALYEYDAFNQLTMSYVNGETVNYTYRADGLRHAKETSQETISHLWDGSNIVADMSGSTVVASYVRGINLLRTDASTGQSYYLYNGHGDVTGLADAAGSMVWLYDYDAFGNQREIDGQDASLDGNPFRYCGEYFDIETGTVYLRARYYDPAIGRFGSEDPIRDGLNWYTYAGNSPLVFIDPFGLAMVQLREWFDDKYSAMQRYFGADKVSGSLNWDSTSRTAKVSMAGNGHSGHATFAPGTNGSYIDPTNNRLYVDDQLLWAAFGPAIDPGLKTDWLGEGLIAAGSLGIAKTGIAAAGVASKISPAAAGTSFGTMGTLIAQNPQITVNWSTYAQHGLSRMAERGITQQMVDTWVSTGKVLQQGADKFAFITKQGMAVVTSAGKLITAYSSAQYDAAMKEIVNKLFGG